MAWKVVLVGAAALGLAAQAGAQELPPQPKLGEPLSAAVDWCQTAGAKIEKQQDAGFIFIGCRLGAENSYTFGGTEASGYRIETAGAVLLAPYRKLRNWQGPYYCEAGYGNSSCHSFVRQGNGMKSHALVYFNSEQDQHAIWKFGHSLERR